MPAFRVMAYNILFGGVGRETRIRDVVTAIQPDVAVFTEVKSPESFEVIAQAVGPHRAEGAIRKNGQQAVIVSRWPILESRLHGPPWAPQKWVEATLQPFGGPPVSVCGVHLVPQPLWPFELCRHIEVRTLVEKLPPREGAPRIIAGDFNALMPGDEFRREHAELWVRLECAVQGGWPRWALKGLVDAGYVDCYRACHERGGGLTVPAWDPAVRLDYVFASPSLRPSLKAAGTFEPGASGASATKPARRSLAELLGWRPVRSLGDAASDHLPVWADFEWPSTRRAHPDDAEAITSAHIDSIQSIGPAFYSPDVVEAWRAGLTPDIYVQAMNGGEAFFIATGLGDEPVVLGFSTHRVDDGQHGVSVYVRGSAARRGIGTTLLRMAESHARAQGAALIEIEASLPGVEFYRMNGFEELGRGQVRLKSGPSIPCVFMRKRLA